MNDLPISESNWERLVNLNTQADWAVKGVFGTGIGPGYVKGGLLYVGNSAGPKGKEVGSDCNQQASVNASINWLTERQNPNSSFWQFIEKIDPTRQTLAWTNVSKMDKVGAKQTPQGNQWKLIAEACIAALADEIRFLKPKITVFAISKPYAKSIQSMLNELGYFKTPLEFDDTFTNLFANESGKFAIQTRQPQGWNCTDRDRVTSLIESLM